MLNPLDILKIFKKNNIDFFTGVPDSVIKSLSAELEKKILKITLFQLMKEVQLGLVLDII